MSIGTKVPIDRGTADTIPTKGTLHVTDTIDGAVDASGAWDAYGVPDFGRMSPVGAGRLNAQPTPPGHAAVRGLPADGVPGDQPRAQFAGGLFGSKVVD